MSPSLRSCLLTAFLTFAACATNSNTASPAGANTPERATVVNEIEASAQVVAIDRAQRRVVMRVAGGRLTDIVCPPEVRNFDQLKAGDRLKVKYREELTATKLAADAPDQGSNASLATGRAPVGERPAAAVDAVASVRVKIMSIDAARDVVVFLLPSGELVAHKLKSDEGRAFVKGLQIGDRVQLDTTVAAALSVESTGR